MFTLQLFLVKLNCTPAACDNLLQTFKAKHLSQHMRLLSHIFRVYAGIHMLHMFLTVYTLMCTRYVCETSTRTDKLHVIIGMHVRKKRHRAFTFQSYKSTSMGKVKSYMLLLTAILH